MHFYYKTLLTVGFLLVRRRKHGLYLTGIKAKILNASSPLIFSDKIATEILHKADLGEGPRGA